jgi:serine protease AprX
MDNMIRLHRREREMGRGLSARSSLETNQAARHLTCASWCLAAALVLPALSATAAEPSPEFKAALSDPSAGPMAIIVYFGQTVDLTVLEGDNRGLIEALHRNVEQVQPAWRKYLLDAGATNLRELWAINALACDVPRSLAARLVRLPGVDHVRLDLKIAAPQGGPGAPAAPEWNVKAIKAPRLWALGFAGEGVVIGSLDTGVELNHPELKPRWRGGSNSWFDPSGEYPEPADPVGHGTQSMGIMVGGSAGGTAIGVAPGAQWIAAKIFDDAGVATLSNIHLALQWMLDPDGDPATNDAPDVINNSWDLGGEVGLCDREFEADLKALKAVGVELVFAAGNDGGTAGTSISPANYSQSLAIGADLEAGAVASFSARGPSACDGRLYPDLVAPGVDVRTSDLSYGGFVVDPYVNATGTSFAAPHVAGAFALLKSAFPGASAAGIERALMATATRPGESAADNASGHGRIDVEAAYRLLTAGLDRDRAAIGSITLTPPTPIQDGQPVSAGRSSGCGTSPGTASLAGIALVLARIAQKFRRRMP